MYYVYYGTRQNFRNKQPIDSFHVNLNELKLIWLDDSLVSRRIRATSTEMRQMLTNALDFPNILSDGNLNQCYAKYGIANEPLVELLTELRNGTAEERIFLTQLHSLDTVLLTKKIDELQTKNPNALIYGDVAKTYDQYMLIECVEDMENVQTQQFESHKQAIDEVVDLKFAADPIDLNESRAVLNEFSLTLLEFIEELDEDRKDHWENEEHNQMVAMRANLTEYFDDDAGVSAEDKAICQNTIDTIDHQLKTVLHAKQNVQQIQMQKQKIQADLIKIVGSMDTLVNSLDDVAKNILHEKITR